MKLLLLLLPFFQQQTHKIHLTGVAQGTTWTITYYAEDAIVTKHQIDSILLVIDSSLSLYKPYSLISQFNKSSTGISVDTHFVNVINKSIETYRVTKGAFDITYKSKCVGSDKLYIKGDSVIKKEPCIIIDANGIAQGYSVDVIAEFLLSNNINDFLVELGGEIRVAGKEKKIGIEAPADNDSPDPFIQKIITVDHGAVTTSGNYRKKDHIVNPKTGQPAANGLVSVTVYAQNAITADAYDNALMVMGLKKAKRFVKRKKELGVYFIYRDKEGNFKEFASKRFTKLFN